MADEKIERFWHEVERLTVGQLRDALRGLPDPGMIGRIVAAAMVLLHVEHGRTT